MQRQEIFALKGQARRLRTALRELQMPVTHATALNLIARVHEARNWETIEAQAEAAQASTAAREDWLRQLEDEVRRQGFTEEDLDGLVHDAGCKNPSSVNNEGMSAQLAALLALDEEFATACGGDPRAALVDYLHKELDGLELPSTFA